MKLDLLKFLMLMALLVGAMVATAFAGTELPPLPQGDVVLSGEGFEVGALRYTDDGVTTVTVVDIDVRSITLRETPTFFVERLEQYRALTAEIDSLTSQIVGLALLISEAEALIFAKQSMLINKQADLEELQMSEQLKQIENPSITLGGPTTGTLTWRRDEPTSGSN